MNRVKSDTQDEIEMENNFISSAPLSPATPTSIAAVKVLRMYLFMLFGAFFTIYAVHLHNSFGFLFRSLPGLVHVVLIGILAADNWFVIRVHIMVP